jgi:hypothetical protein
MAALGIAWDVQAVPKRIYEEARVVKAQRATRKIPSILDRIDIETTPISLGLEPE